MLRYTFELTSEYELREFEKGLAFLEISKLAKQSLASVVRNGTSVEVRSRSPLPTEGVLRLAFTERVRVKNAKSTQEYVTHQTYLNRLPKLNSKGIDWNVLEAVRASKREHSYATHGFHPYKGKYYPQLVGAIINACLGSRKGLVLDPFCGSGTTLVEASLLGIESIGVDFHPLAVLMSRVKVQSLTLHTETLEAECSQIVSNLEKDFLEKGLRVGENTRLWRARSRTRLEELYSALPVKNVEYLKAWFDPLTLAELATVLCQIKRVKDPRFRELCLVNLSGFVREVSLQEPSSLRILRRKEVPEPRVLDRFSAGLRKKVDSLKAVRLLEKRLCLGRSRTTVIQGDVKSLDALLKPYLGPGGLDCVVTSPPYAMALPYIDTDRLSLFLLGLIEVEDRSSVEAEMVGNREISKKVRHTLEDLLDSDEVEQRLPPGVLSLVRSIHRRNKSADVGFRKLNTPGLLLKYFLDMEAAFRHCYSYMRRGGHLVYIVGINTTEAGNTGKRVRIQTDELLREVGERIGFRCDRVIPMTDQAAYMRHSRNFIREESIVFLRKP